MQSNEGSGQRSQGGQGGTAAGLQPPCAGLGFTLLYASKSGLEPKPVFVLLPAGLDGGGYSDFNTYTCSNKIFYSSSFRKNENRDGFYKKYKSEIDYES